MTHGFHGTPRSTHVDTCTPVTSSHRSRAVRWATALLAAAAIWPGAALAAPRTPSPTATSTETPTPATPTTASPDVLRATLDNGLRVVVVHNPLAPVVTTVVNYLVGSNEAPAGFPGMAHAQEHMMFRGSPGLSAGQLAAVTAAMGGMFDADTQQMVTQYFFTVPAEDLDVALHIEAIRMRGVLDSEKLWSEERGAIEQEVARDLSNPQYRFYTELLADIFRGTPYAHDALGTTASFNATTGSMLKKFHDTWYAPNNAILVIAGDVDPARALARVKKLFAGIPSKKLPERPAFHLEPVSASNLALTTDLPVGIDAITFRTPGYDSPDYAAVEVLADVLNSQRGRLYALVPEGKALFAGFQLDTLPKSGLGQALAAFPAGADAKALSTELRQVLAEIAKNGVPADLVAAAKRRAAADAELEKTSMFGQAMAWSDALAVRGWSSPSQGVEAIKNVTVDDVNRVARTWLDLDHAVTAVLTPQPSGQPVSGKGFGGTESFSPGHVGKVNLPDWAEKALHRLTIPTSTVQPVVTILDNDIRLIVQPESVSDTVTLYGHIRNQPDLETPPGQEGVSQVLDGLFSWGTTSLDRLAFQKALDEIAANVSAGTDFSLEVPAGGLDRGIELLADNLLHPALPPAAFTVVRRQTASAVAGELSSPGYKTGRAITMGLYPSEDPTLRQATPASVSSLSLDDVKAYHRKVFRPDLTTIVMIGNITPEGAKDVIQKYFGTWKAVGPAPLTLLGAVPANKPSTTVVPNPSRVQDQVTLAQTLQLVRSNPDYYALELGNHVLGGGFYATRLYEDLREKTGLVYTVSSSFDVGRTRSTYTVAFGCKPANVAKARSIVVRDLTQMQKEPVPAERLEQAKAMLLRQIPLAESSFDSIAGGLLDRVALDLPLDEPTRAAHRYVALTAADVQTAFAKWVRPDGFVEVVQGPEPAP